MSIDFSDLVALTPPVKGANRPNDFVYHAEKGNFTLGTTIMTLLGALPLSAHLLNGQVVLIASPDGTIYRPKESQTGVLMNRSGTFSNARLKTNVLENYDVNESGDTVFQLTPDSINGSTDQVWVIQPISFEEETVDESSFIDDLVDVGNVEGTTPAQETYSLETA